MLYSPKVIQVLMLLYIVQITALKATRCVVIHPASTPAIMSLADRLSRVQTTFGEDGLESFKRKSLEEMHAEPITFGRAHLGKTFLEVWTNEPRWLKWFLKTYESSSKTDHLRLIHYCSVMIERIELEASLPEMEPEQMPVVPKAKPKPKARPATQIGSMEPPAEFPRSDEEDLESWGAVPPIETDENISALQQRMLHMENAMTEVLSHLRAQRQ